MNYEKLMSKKNAEGKDAVDFLNEASDLMDKDKFKNASELLTQGIHLCGHPRLFFNRGYCYHQLKDYKNAVKDFSKSIANDRGNDLLDHEKQRLYLYMGIIYEETDEEDNAIESYKKAADWGYSGAIARLEKFGITYIPNSKDEQAESEKKSASASQAATLESKSKSDTKQSLKPTNAASSSPKKKSKLRFLLPCLIGIACGICAFLLLRQLPQINAADAAAKRNVIKASVTSETLNLCAEPFMYSDVIKILYYGYVVEITGDASGDYIPVQHEDSKGWVDKNSIEIDK